MSSRPPSDPHSPVQEGGRGTLLPAVLVAVLVSLLFWGWQQDWTSDAPDEPEAAVADVPVQRDDGPLEEPSPPPAQPARANLAAYFTDDDYPVGAIRRDEQGQVAFALAVSPEGRITNCRIATSSGSADLDAATCRILRSRARFQPAQDADGAAVADVVRGRIRWVLPPG